MKDIRCLLGWHKLEPRNGIAQRYAAVFKAGKCIRCGEVIFGKFLYNCWKEQTVREDYVHLIGTNPQLESDLVSGKYQWFSITEKVSWIKAMNHDIRATCEVEHDKN